MIAEREPITETLGRPLLESVRLDGKFLGKDFTMEDIESIFGEHKNDTEKIIVSLAKQASAKAQGLIFFAFHDRIAQYVISRVGDVGLTEDITQDVFVRAFAGISSYQYRNEHDNFLAWMFRIAHNRMASHFRSKAGQTVNFASTQFELLDETANPEYLTSVQNEADDLEKAVNDLPSEERNVITERFYSDNSISETARLLGKTEGCVKALQHKGINRLRRKFLLSLD